MHLVDDILEFSGLEAHQTVLRTVPVRRCARCVEDVERRGRSRFAESRRPRPSPSHVDDSVPTTGRRRRRRRVAQVVTNLVQNAIALHRARLRRRARHAAAPCSATATGADIWVEFAVSDTGHRHRDEDHLRNAVRPVRPGRPARPRGRPPRHRPRPGDLPRAGRPDGRQPPASTSTLGAGSAFTFGRAAGARPRRDDRAPQPPLTAR